MSTAEACVFGAAPKAVDAPEDLAAVEELRVGLETDDDDFPGHSTSLGAVAALRRAIRACSGPARSWRATPRDRAARQSVTC